MKAKGRIESNGIFWMWIVETKGGTYAKSTWTKSGALRQMNRYLKDLG